MKNSVGFFFTFYYSFFTIFPDGTDIIPIDIVAKITRMSGVVVGVLINLLLLTVYLTISNEKFKENLSNLSDITDNYSKEIQIHFENKYGYNPTEGLNKIKNLGSSIDGLIVKIKELIKILSENKIKVLKLNKFNPELTLKKGTGAPG